MTYTVGYKDKFKAEFKRFPRADQKKIAEFVTTFQAYGLSDFSRYVGKIAPSWGGENTSLAKEAYAQQHDLWHYHIGVPYYEQIHPLYKTSDWLLHFQWRNGGRHIDLCDFFPHYRSDGEFYLPPLDALA